MSVEDHRPVGAETKDDEMEAGQPSGVEMQHQKASLVPGKSPGELAGVQHKKPRLLDTPLHVRLWELVSVLLPAGCYAFGGPTAHLAVFQDLFVKKHGWLNDKEFLDLLALGMTLPGPTSTEFAIAVGAYRAGVIGATVSFLAWSIPSLAVMIAAGHGMSHMRADHPPDWMKGLAPAAVVLIFIAFARLAQKLVDTPLKFGITLVAAAVTLIVQDDPRISPRTILWLLPVLLIIGGLLTLGQKLYNDRRAAAAAARAQQAAVDANGNATAASTLATSGAMGQAEVTEDTYDLVPIPVWFSVAAVGAIAAFLLYLLGMQASGRHLSPMMQMFSSFFILGITVYGGGQVILPLFVSLCVKPGWLTMEQFLEGFALVQMLPGPLFNLSAYIGTIYKGWAGAFVGWAGLFLPGFLLVMALLPLWDRIRKVPNVKPFLSGVNSAGLGLILAVGVQLYLKVVQTPADAVVTLVAAGIVGYLGYSSLFGVLIGAIVGFLLTPTCLNVGQTLIRRA